MTFRAAQYGADDDDEKIAEDKPHVSVTYKNGANIWLIPEDYQRIKKAFREREPDIVCTGMYQQEVVLRLSDVSQISHYTAESIACLKAEEKIERKRAMLNGGA